MKQQLLILAVIAVLFVHCRKKDHEPTTTESNHFLNSGLSHFIPLQLFTHDGEVLNPGLAQSYQNEFSQYFFKPGDAITDPFYNEIIFINDDSIRYVTPGRTYGAKRTGTDAYDRFSTPYYNLVNDTSSLEFYIVHYKILHRMEITGNPNSFVYEADDPVFFLKKEKDTFFMPIIKYAVISRSPGIVSFVSSKLNNVFSAGGVSHLAANDTLLVQSFDISFVKGK